MKTSVAVFESHDEAINALTYLKDHGYPMSKVSLVGKAELVDDRIQVPSKEENPLIDRPTLTGSLVGTTVGLLTGIGLFAIPGLGFLYGAGAIIGAIGGFDLGLVVGGTTSLLKEVGFNEEHSSTYAEYVEKGKFLVMVNGTQEEIENARKIIGENHVEFDIHDHPIKKRTSA